MRNRPVAPLAGPDHAHAWRESRALLDAGRMVLPLLLPAGKARAVRPRNIIVMPGFGADDRATWPLRRYLRKQAELMAAAEGREFRRPRVASTPLEEAHAVTRAKAARRDDDREFATDTEAVAELVTQGAFTRFVPGLLAELGCR